MVLVAGFAVADDAPLPKAAEIEALAIHPAAIALKSGDDTAQVIVTATLADGRLVDLTQDVFGRPQRQSACECG